MVRSSTGPAPRPATSSVSSSSNGLRFVVTPDKDKAMKTDAASFAADEQPAAPWRAGAIAGQLSGVDASAISVDLSSSGASSVSLAYTGSASSAESAQAIILKFLVCLHLVTKSFL